MQKKNLFSFHFRVHSNFAITIAKLRKVERKTKKLVSFFCRDGVTSRSNDRRVTQKQEKIFNILCDSAKLTYWTLDNWTIGQN